MSNFRIDFVNSPWLLLLLIPALFLTFFPYFRMARRYRRTRNRIVSIILHVIIMVLSISVLAGLRISFELPNAENELVILVDSSFSDGDDETEQDKANFIYNVVEANQGRSKVAVVRFAYDQKVILGMGNHSADEVYDRLDFGEVEDNGATDIRAALEFVWNPKTKTSSENLITYPKTAKILVISDGLQTDQDALAVARSINSDGIRIDTVQFKDTFSNEVRIVGVTFPEQNLAVSEDFELEVTIQSNVSDEVVLTATDEDESGQKEIPSQTFNVSRGLQTVRLPYAFDTPGHHELSFHITSEKDSITENNAYYAYYDLVELNKVLIIERYTDESQELNAILNKEVNEDNYYEVTTARYSDFDSIPKTVDEMRMYDQIILCNISHQDMGQIDPQFEENINSYAYEYGGGVLTVGGQERNDSGQVVMETVDGVDIPKAHSYDRDDMKDTTYQKMLPVDIIDYTPPLALIIILDQSGSMGQSESSAGDALEVAGTGALACVDALSQRDWVGVMGLKDSYTTALDMTPCTQKNRIRAAIRQASQHADGGTYYYPALDRACLALSSMTSVERKHIILISDAGHADSWDGAENPEGIGWSSLFERSSYKGISVSVVTIGSDTEPTDSIKSLCDYTGGRSYHVTSSDIQRLPELMLEEISLPEITGVNASEEYHPEINSRTAITGSEITQEMLDEITMKGFFGSKEKVGGTVTVPLNAKFVPLYAQWQYGRGMVGSFMCDLHGEWSEEFINSKEAGVPIINNIVSALMPTTNIRAQAIRAEFTEDNYRTNVSVFGDLEADKKLVAIVQAPAPEGSFDLPDPVKYDLSAETAGGNRFTFENKEPGIHSVTILKVDKNFDIFNSSIRSVDDISESDYSAILETYRVFSYSEEYNVIREADDTEGEELLKTLATYGDGNYLGVNDVEKVYDGFLAHEIVWAEDLWTAFIIISLIFFLLDVAVRKFKWKWPHEVIRDRKARKAMARN